MIDGRVLENEIRQLLARMELLSEAATAKLQAHIGRSKASSVALTPNGPVLADEWRKRFEQHWDDLEALVRLLKAGQAALELRVHGARPIHDRETSDEWVLSGVYEGVDCETVAAIESERGSHCSPQYVLWLRRRNDCTDAGYPKPPSQGRLRALDRLKVEHPKWSQMRYAEHLGVSQSTVSRLMRAAEKVAA